MIHTFKAVGQPMMLDVGSGAVHALDDLAYDVLTLWNDCTAEEIKTQLKDKYTQEELDEVIGELRQLEEIGALNAPDNYDDVKQLQDPGVVKSMCLHVAHDCNLRCKYCFAATGDFCMGERKLLSYEVGKKALDWLVEKSGKRVHLEVDFFGGEPLMNFDVMKRLVEYGRSIEAEKNKKFKFTTTTNCVLMTEEIMDFFNKEMGNVVISMDGRPEVHDRMRPTVNGKGSYAIIAEKAKEFAKRRGHQEYYVRGTFTGYNKDFANDVLFLADEGFEQLSVEPVVTDPACEYALHEEDLPQLREEYERLAVAYMDRRANGKWFNFFHFNVDLEGGPCLRKRLTGCGAGNEYIAVTPDGDIYPCHQFVGREGYRMGSVLDGTFNSELQKKFANNHVLTKEKCRDCWARFYCSGGCAANAEAFHGDISKPYDMECQLERKRLECAMAIYAKERAAKQGK
ncbi:MAG: thioether cross-link-forming SCIFF peptide maturase [Clostridia bacterium]|nr:thioether cross-link-forming SCIFF peptide maturase [Clostridia bacterium]